MAEKQGFAEILGSSKQPVSAENVPSTFSPIEAGNDNDLKFNNAPVDKGTLFKNFKKFDNPIAEAPLLDYSGKYYKGAASDPEQRAIQGENQPTFKKWTNGIVGHTLSVATKVGTGVGEMGGGAFDLISNLIPGVAADRKEEQGTMFPHLFENFFTKGANYLENDLIEQKLLPVYTGKKGFSNDLMTRMGDAKSWASDMADAVAFTASAAVGVGAFSKAAKLAGWAIKGAEGLELTSKGKLFTQIGSAIWNTGMEAGLEAKQQLDTSRSDLSNKMFGLTYSGLDDEQKKSVNEIAGKAASNVFKSNVAILIGPDLIMSRFMIGPVKNSADRLKKAIRLGKLDPKDISMMKKALIQGGIGVFSEGPWEEGTQYAVQIYEQKLVNGDTDLKRMPGLFHEWLDGFNNVEGQESRLMGSIVGLTMGGYSANREARDEKKGLKGYKEYVNKQLATLDIADKTLPGDIRHPFKEFEREVPTEDGKTKKIRSILNDKGETEWDMNKVMSLYHASQSSKSLIDNLRMAVLNGDEVKEKFHLNVAVTQLAHKYLSNEMFGDSNEAFDKLKANNPFEVLANDEDLKKLGLDYDYMNGILSKVKQEWDEVIKNTKDKEDLTNTDKTYLDYKNKVKKAALYQRMKLNWLNDIDSIVEDKTQLDGLRDDAQNDIDVFESKVGRKDLYKQYLDNEENNIDSTLKRDEELKKDPNSIEAKKYQYLIDENKSIYGDPKVFNQFTITEDLQNQTVSGLKNKHFYDIGADAVVGARFDNAIDSVSRGGTNVLEAASILEKTANEAIETRGKYDVKQEDINRVMAVVGQAEKNLKEQIMSEQEYNDKLDAINQEFYGGEQTQEEIDKRDADTKELNDAHEIDKKKQSDFDKSIGILNSLDPNTNPNAKSLSSYKDDLTKEQVGDSKFQRTVADEPIKEGNAIYNIVKANKDAYNDSAKLEKIIRQLKERKELYEKTDLKDRLSDKSFKGYIESIDKLIDKLEKDILDIVKKNASDKKRADIQNQKYRNVKKFHGIGLSIAKDGTISVLDKELNDFIKNILGETVYNKILSEAKELGDQVGEEYLYHEVFVDKIIALIKANKDVDKKNQFLALVYKKFGYYADEFKNRYTSISTIQPSSGISYSNSNLDDYKENPRKLIKDIIIRTSGVRLNNTRKTALDKFKNNNDILELKDNLQNEDETGYAGFQKELLLSLVDRTIIVEGLQDIIDSMESAYVLTEELELEEKIFSEKGLAPTNQQITAIRQAVRWFKKPLRQIANLKERRFASWLFIKGNAGTGKTQVAIQYILNSLNIKPENVTFIAPHTNAQKMLDKQSLSSQPSILASALDAIPETTKIVIIDEIAALNNEAYVLLAEKLEKINKDRSPQFRIIALGDPNQVSAQQPGSTKVYEPSINNTDLTGSKYLNVVDPLTIKHRSLISEVNEVNDIFEDNHNDVSGITVYASDKVGNAAVGVHSGNTTTLKQMITVHRNNGKSKVIVVATEADKQQYKDAFPELADNVFTFTEVAGVEFDESYVDLSREEFSDASAFNRAYYTAMSRATQYIFLKSSPGIIDNAESKEMLKDYIGDGKSESQYQEVKRKMLDERKANFRKRLDVEKAIMAGTAVKLTKQEKKEEVAKQEEEIVKNSGNNIDEVYQEPDTDDSNDNVNIEEDDSKDNIGNIEVKSGVSPDTHVLKFAQYSGSKFIETEKNKGTLTLKLKPGGKVIYVKTKPTVTGSQNGATVYILGQLYDNEGNEMPKRYTILGIMGNDEFFSDFGKEITKKLINTSLFNVVEEKDGIVMLDKVSDEVNKETIVGEGTLNFAKPLSYYYKQGEPTFKGPGFIEKLKMFINDKLFGNKTDQIDYRIQIFTPKTIQQYSTLAGKNLYMGVPYMLISRKKKGDTTQRTQFIRLNPTNLSRNNKQVIVLRKFYEAVQTIENVIESSSHFGTPEFNDMISMFSKNYTLDGDNVVYQGNNLKFEDYDQLAISGKVVELTEKQFHDVESLVEPVITAVYGKGKRRVSIDSEAEMKTKYLLDTNNQSEGYTYIFEQRDNSNTGYVVKRLTGDPKDKGDYITEPVLKAGIGEAQTALNIIAKANEKVDGQQIRVQKFIKRGTTGLMNAGKYIKLGKSLMTTSESNEGYYQALRRILLENKQTEVVHEFEEDGAMTTKTQSPYIDIDNVADAEERIKEKGYLTGDELEKLKDQFVVHPITSEMLSSIVMADRNRFPGDTHTELRTPLIMEQINEWGDNNISIGKNLDEIEENLQSNLSEINPTTIGVDTKFSTEKYTDVSKSNETKNESTKPSNESTDEFRDISSEDASVLKKVSESIRKNLKRDAKKLRDTGPIYLGSKASNRSIIRMIKRMIPSITDDQIKFLERDALDFIADDHVWGLFKDGIIHLAQDTVNTTRLNVARHEVFHKIWNNFLSPAQQLEIEKMAKKEFGDYSTYGDFEEFLAVKFQNYQRGLLNNVSDFFKSLFIKIARYIGFYNANIDSIEDLFFQINHGLIDYRSSLGDNSSKKMRDIVKRFDSLDNYLDILKMVHNQFYNVRMKGVNGMHVTRKETEEVVLRRLLEDAIKIEDSKTEDVAELRILKQLTLLTDNKDNWKDIVSDIFPGFNNYEGGVFKSNLIEDVKEEIRSERPSVNNNVHIIDNTRVNTETTVSDEIKEILSYVKGEDGEFLSWRYVYVKMLDLFEGLNLDQKDSLGKDLALAQIKEGFKSKELTINEQSILNHIETIHAEMVRDISYSGIEFSNGKFLSEDMFVYSENDDVQDIKHKDDPRVRIKLLERGSDETDEEYVERIKEDAELNGNKAVIYERRAGESTSDYLRRINKVSGFNARMLFDLGTKQYHNQMFKMIVSHFNSHRQRNPVIGERKVSFGSYEIRYFNARGTAVANGVRERLLSTIGDKIKTEADANAINEKIKLWNVKYNNDSKEYVKAFLNYIGLSQYANTLTNNNTQAIKQHIQNAFPALIGLIGKPMNFENKKIEEATEGRSVKKSKKGSKEVNSIEQQRIDDETSLSDRYYTAEYILEHNSNSFLNDLTKAITLLDNLSRILSSSDAKGNRRYNAVLTSFGHKGLFNIINSKFGTKHTGFNNLLLDRIYRSKFFKNNIFINQLTRAYEVHDDDGLKFDNYYGEQYSSEYKNEKREDYNFRTFVLGFLSTISQDGADKQKRYMQFLYPNGDRKTPTAIKVNVLNRVQAIDAIKSTIRQLKSRSKESEKRYSNYSVDSTNGFDVLQDVIGKKNKISEIKDKDIDSIALDVYLKLNEMSRELAQNMVTDQMAFDSRMPLRTELDKVIDKQLYPNSYANLFERNKSGHLKLKQTSAEFEAANKKDDIDLHNAWEKGESKKYLVKVSDIEGLVASFFVNDYINGYHLNQLVIGDMAGLKSSADIAKRISIPLAPGKTGYVNDKYGMNETARVAVMREPIRSKNNVSEFLTALLGNVSKEEIDNIVSHLPEKGFYPADSMTFVLPERVQDINYGFGTDFGRILKGVYYHIEDDGIGRSIKTASIELSDELVSKHPALNTLREKMRNNPDGVISEVIFAQAIKNGSPHEEDQNDFYKLTDDTQNIVFTKESQFDIYNKDFRIQQDPEAEIDSEVSYPTQIAYMMNLYGGDNVEADLIYKSFAKIIESNFSSLDSWMSGKNFTLIIKDFFMKSKQDNVKELLSEGINPNFPAIADKLVQQFTSTIFNRVVKNKFQGTKLVLQTAVGSEKVYDSEGAVLNKGKTRELQLRTDKDGRPYYETILPMGLLTKEHERNIGESLKKGEEPKDFYYASIKGKQSSRDLMGFRVPSSEIHSSVPIKVVGFYDSKGTNAIIVPEILVQIHGSDFDVDSLFVIKRTIEASYDKLIPVGYTKESDSTYIFHDENSEPDYLDKIIRRIEQYKAIDPLNKIDIRKVKEAYYQNQILESFLSAITKKENIIRMTDPISVSELQEEKDRMKRATKSRDEFDISNPIDRQKMHSLIYAGENSISMFMSLFKSFAFMHRAGIGEAITSIKEDTTRLTKRGETKLVEKLTIKFNGKTYDSLTDIDEEGKSSGYRFDSLSNAALDNAKELILSYLNIDKETIRAYSALVMHGVKTRTINNFISQPILKYYTKYGAYDANLLVNKLENRYKGTDLSNIELTDDSMEKYLEFNENDIAQLISLNDLEPFEEDMLKLQIVAYRQYMTTKSLGESIGKLAKLTNSIRTFPSKISEMEEILSTAKSIMGIKNKDNITTTPSDKESSFPYKMENFFKINPHILSALKTMEWTVNKINLEFITYNPTYRKLADKVISATGIKLDKNDATNNKMVRDEFVKFMMTSLVNREYIKTTQETIWKNGRKKEISLSGINAYNSNFVNMLKEAQLYDNILYEQSLKNKDAKPYAGNLFLQSLSTKANSITGRPRIQYNGPVSMETSEYNLYKQSFEQLNNFDFDYIDGKWILHKNPTINGYTTFQKMFVDYAIINYGMSMGLRNYTKVLPAEIYKDVNDKLIPMMEKVLSYSDDELTNFTNAFKAQVSLNFPDGINKKSIKTDGVKIIKEFKLEINPETGKEEKVYAGEVGGVYYDKAFTSTNPEESWPEYHVEKWDDDIIVYRRISDSTGTKSYYERIGYKNLEPIYDLRFVDDALAYNEEEAFNPTFDGINIRSVKGSVVHGIYENKYNKFNKGEIVSMSEYSDPGKMYAKEYRVTGVHGTIYQMEEIKPYGKAYFEESSREVNIVYEALLKTLKAKSGPYRSIFDKIVVKKQSLGEGRLLYQKINREQFRGLKVIYEYETGLGIEININKKLLGEYLYGQQLDLFGKAFYGNIINEVESKGIQVANSSDISKLGDTIYSINREHEQRVNEYRNLYDNKSVSKILDEMDARTSNAFMKMMIKFIKPLIAKSKVVYEGDGDLGNGKLGMFFPTGDIHLNYNALAEDGADIAKADRIMLHEMVHAISLIQLMEDSKFSAQVIKWMNQLIEEHPEYLTDYSVKKAFSQADGSEFISEFFSNEILYNKLNSISSKGESRSIGRKIVDWITEHIFRVKDITYAAKMDKWLRKNMETLPYVKYIGGKYYNFKGEDITDKFKGSEFSTIEDTKFLKDVVKQGEDITNPVDDKGNEADFYVDSLGNKFKRGTDIVTGWISNFRKTGKSESYGERLAKVEWTNVDHDVKRNIDGKNFTFDEYKKELDKRQVDSSVRGRIIHYMSRIINDRIFNDGKEEARLRNDIQHMAYKDYEVEDSEGKKTTISINLDPEQFNWFLEKSREIYHSHGINALDDIPKELKDIVVSEVPISLKELGYAGTADMIVEHHDGTLSIKDFATGTNFDRFITQRMMHYGERNRQILDNPRDRKKMQIMLYALMIKAKNPDVKFKDLSIMYVPNQYQATTTDPLAKVDVEDFLGIIQSFLRDKDALKEAGIDANIYETLKNMSPKIFNVSEYTHEYTASYSTNSETAQQIQDELISELGQNEKDPVKLTAQLIGELKKIIGQAPVVIGLGKNQYEWLSNTDKIKAMNLTHRILQLIKDPNVSMNIDAKLDVSVITAFLGNYSDIAIPQVQMWLKFRDEREHAANVEFWKKDVVQKSLLRKVLDDYYAANPTILRNKKWMNFNNYAEIFKFMYKEFNNNGSMQQRMLHEDIVEDKAEIDALTENQRNYINFLNNHYASYFEGQDALANQVASYWTDHKGTKKQITVLEQYNMGVDDDNKKFHYYKGWFPKAHKEESEMIYEGGEGSYLKGLFSKKYIMDMLHDNMTYFRENSFEGRNHSLMVLPLKNMGSFHIDNNRKYTLNAEFQFDQFTKSMEYKRQMDGVYAFGEGIRMSLDMQKNKDQPIYANTSSMFEKKLTQDILGRTIRHNLVRKPMRMPTTMFGMYEDTELRSDALLMLTKSWTSATLMWLKPFTGGGNGVNAMLLQHKDALKGTVGSMKIFGIEGDAIDTTFKDQLKADGEVLGTFIKNSVLGKTDQDKTWLLVKKLQYFPDNFDFKSSEKYLLSTRNRAIAQSSMYAFHTIPEEAVSMMTMVAQLKHFKHPDGRSLWDCYDVEKDPITGEYDVVWKGGSRGMLREGSGENTHYTEIHGLLPQEMSHMKKVYEKLQGGYRKEEAAAVEVYVLGKVFMTLKKYYPRLLLNAFASRRSEQNLGTLKLMNEKHEGQDIYEWYRKMNEGRFQLIGKLLLSSVLMGAGNRDYKWKNLPPELRLHVVDAGVTLGMWFMAYAAYLKMFGDDKDNDSLKMWWKMYMMDNFIQQYSAEELMKVGVQGISPVPFTRSLQTVQAMSTMMGATWDLTVGDKEKAFTEMGDLRGWNQFKKAIPVFASYYDFAKRTQNNNMLRSIFDPNQSKMR